MNTFLVIAAIMAAIAATAVALPLLRNRQSRVLGAVAGVAGDRCGRGPLSALVELGIGTRPASSASGQP